MIPLVARYDSCEHVTGPPLPHLFQRRVGWKHDVMNYKMLSRLIGGALTRAGITGQTGQPLRYLPHDFRRIFTTDAVTGGLPVHIAARLLGHASVTTTEAYLAVFQDDLIRSYRAFLNGRRAARPARGVPRAHRRRVARVPAALHRAQGGTRRMRPALRNALPARAACVRCPMLRVSPRQRPRLAEIIRNLTERVAEARANGWLGEVQGLQVSLAKAKEKLASLDRTLDRSSGRQAGPTDLGMPIITNPLTARSRNPEKAATLTWPRTRARRPPWRRRIRCAIFRSTLGRVAR